MADSNSPTPVRLVVFDLGGVLARISHTWEEACLAAGITPPAGGTDATPLADLPVFDPYQMGAIGEDDYLAGIAAWAGCTLDEAQRIHNHILIEPYPGSEELIEDLQARGVSTGCLSNTNAPHWDELAVNGRFPAIVALERKMASHLVGMNKPDPQIFRYYSQVYGIAPEAIVYFEDNAANVRAALEVGFRAKQIDPNGDTVAQVREFLREQGVL